MLTVAKHKASWIWKSVLRLISVTLCLSAAQSVTWTQDLLVHLSTLNYGTMCFIEPGRESATEIIENLYRV